MTLPAQDTRTIQNGNGTTDDFTIGFEYFFFKNVSGEYLKVYLRDETDPDAPVEIPQDEGALQDYTLTGGDVANGIAPTHVTFNTPPGADFKVVMLLELPFAQDFDPAPGNMNPEALEDMLDYLMGCIQTLKEISSRTLVGAVTSSINGLSLPDPEALYLLRWNAAGNDLENVAPGLVGTTAYRAGEQALAANDTSVAVVFSSSMADTDYAISRTLRNTTDAVVDFQPITITAKSTTGFTASWGSGVIGNNNVLEWMVIEYA